MTQYYYADTDRMDNARTSWFRSEAAAMAAFEAEVQSWSDRDLQPYTREIVDPSPQEIQAEIRRAKLEGQAHEMPTPVTRYRLYLAPEGSGMEFCSEHETRMGAALTAERHRPRGLPEAQWDTARAAGHCGGLRAPERSGVEDDTPMLWCGDYCVVRTLYCD